MSLGRRENRGKDKMASPRKQQHHIPIVPTSQFVPTMQPSSQQQQQQNFQSYNQPSFQAAPQQHHKLSPAPNPETFQFYQTDYSQQPYQQQFSQQPPHYQQQQQQQQQFFSHPNQSTQMMYQVPVEVSILAAFGTGGLPGEPPLLEELGINIPLIKRKTFTVLNPMQTVDSRIMDDADLWGPILFFIAFGAFLLLSGKAHFSYIYGLAMLGWLSIYCLLNMMSESGLDLYRTASVLGYCLLPMVLLSSLSILLRLKGVFGYGLGIASVFWCTFASSGIFVSVLGMKNQRFLIAYPVALFYACFALITIF